MTSFWRNSGVVIAACVRWVCTDKFRRRMNVHALFTALLGLFSPALPIRMIQGRNVWRQDMFTVHVMPLHVHSWRHNRYSAFSWLELHGDGSWQFSNNFIIAALILFIVSQQPLMICYAHMTLMLLVFKKQSIPLVYIMIRRWSWLWWRCSAVHVCGGTGDRTNSNFHWLVELCWRNIWGLCCQKHISHAGISNYTPQ